MARIAAVMISRPPLDSCCKKSFIDWTGMAIRVVG
jgi:hypothetical protein